MRNAHHKYFFELKIKKKQTVKMFRTFFFVTCLIKINKIQFNNIGRYGSDQNRP